MPPRFEHQASHLGTDSLPIKKKDIPVKIGESIIAEYPSLIAGSEEFNFNGELRSFQKFAENITQELQQVIPLAQQQLQSKFPDIPSKDIELAVKNVGDFILTVIDFTQFTFESDYNFEKIAVLENGMSPEFCNTETLDKFNSLCAAYTNAFVSFNTPLSTINALLLKKLALSVFANAFFTDISIPVIKNIPKTDEQFDSAYFKFTSAWMKLSEKFHATDSEILLANHLLHSIGDQTIDKTLYLAGQLLDQHFQTDVLFLLRPETVKNIISHQNGKELLEPLHIPYDNNFYKMFEGYEENAPNLVRIQVKAWTGNKAHPYGAIGGYVKKERRGLVNKTPVVVMPPGNPIQPFELKLLSPSGKKISSKPSIRQIDFVQVPNMLNKIGLTKNIEECLNTLAGGLNGPCINNKN